MHGAPRPLARTGSIPAEDATVALSCVGRRHGLRDTSSRVKNRVRNGDGKVRIIGGRWRGRRVRFPDLPGLRPTPDRVRETLFNWLSPYLPGARVLDLFAGSGVLAFEALSRGASRAVLVDSSRPIVDGLLDTGRALGTADFEVVAMDALEFLRTRRDGAFDLVFMDPPYGFSDYEGLCRALEASGALEAGSLVYLELSSRRTSTLATPESWEPYRAGRAGAVAYRLWRRIGREPD